MAGGAFYWSMVAKNTIVKNNIIINQHPFRGSIDADANSLSRLVSDYNILTNRMTPDDNTIVDSIKVGKSWGLMYILIFSQSL